MTFEEVKNRIDIANAKSAELNKQRQMNIGKKETLTQQLNAALSDYSTKYGVTLTESNIQSELTRILSEKEKEVSLIEQMITYIESGDFENANLLANPNYVKETETPVEDVTTSTVIPTPVGTVATPTVDETVPTEKKKRGRPKKEAEPIVAPITTATAFVPETTMSVEDLVAPVVESTPVAPTVPTESVAPTPVAPSMPTAPVAPTPVAPSMPTAPVVPTPVAPSMPTAPVAPTPVAPSMPTPPTMPVAPTPVAPTVPTEPVVPSMPTPPVPTPPSMPTAPTPVAPSIPTTPAQTVVSDSNLLGGALDGFVQMATPTAPPTPSAPPMDFASILGGSPFEN